MSGSFAEAHTEASANPWGVFGGALGVLIAVTCGYHFLEPSTGNGQGGNVKWHVIYWAVAVPVIVFVPPSISQYVFSDLTQTAVGVALPIYESVRAVCTPEEEDDKAWLQYWTLGGVIFIITTWVDDVMRSPVADQYWYETMVCFFYWLYFPKTQGATLVYEHLTLPFLAPRIRPLLGKMNNLIEFVYQALSNAVHLWLIWIFFLFLPKGLKRIVAIAVGTVYPFVNSITASATEEIEDDTYWLTYWSVYGCLFLVMDLLETWIGWVPGFYSLVIFSTVYLMLPMFQGADKVFRKILVPLAGLKELLMLRDAIAVKKDMLKNLPPDRAKSVRKAIAKFYDDDDDTADPGELKREFLNSWSGLKIANPFATSSTTDDKKTTPPTETTSLIV